MCTLSNRNNFSNTTTTTNSQQRSIIQKLQTLNWRWIHLDNLFLESVLNINQYILILFLVLWYSWKLNRRQLIFLPIVYWLFVLHCNLNQNQIIIQVYHSSLLLYFLGLLFLLRLVTSLLLAGREKRRGELFLLLLLLLLLRSLPRFFYRPPT